MVSVAQSDRPEKRGKMFVASFSPGATYRALNYASVEEWVEDQRNRIESPKFAFDARVSLAIAAGNKVTVRAGLQFSNKGHRTKKRSLQWSESNPVFPSHSRTRVSYHSLGIPLEVCYFAFGKRDVKLNPFLGIVPEVVINSRTVVTNYAGDERLTRRHSGKSAGYAKFALSVRAGMEVMYSLSKRNCLVAGVMFDHSLTSRLVSSSANEKNYGAYTTIGFARKF